MQSVLIVVRKKLTRWFVFKVSLTVLGGNFGERKIASNIQLGPKDSNHFETK